MHMGANCLRNLLGAIRPASNKEKGNSISVPILGSLTVPQIQDFTSFSYQQAQQTAHSISAVKHRFSSVSTHISSALNLQPEF